MKNIFNNIKNFIIQNLSSIILILLSLFGFILTKNIDASTNIGRTILIGYSIFLYIFTFFVIIKR